MQEFLALVLGGWVVVMSFVVAAIRRRKRPLPPPPRSSSFFVDDPTSPLSPSSVGEPAGPRLSRRDEFPSELKGAPPKAFKTYREQSKGHYRAKMRASNFSIDVGDSYSLEGEVTPELIDRCRAFVAVLDAEAYDPTATPAKIQDVDRSHAFTSATAAVLRASREALLVGADVSYAGEEAVDAGGVVADWCEAVACELCGGGAGLLRPLPDGTLMLAPAPPEDHKRNWFVDDVATGAAATLNNAQKSKQKLAQCLALGRLVGAVVSWAARSIAESNNSATHSAPMIRVPLARALAKLCTREAVDARDVAELDPVFYRTRIDVVVANEDGVETLRRWLGLLDDDNNIPLTFSWYDVTTGEPTVELHPGGGSEVVTSENKRQYARETAEHYLLGAIRPEAGMFVAGLGSVLGERACQIIRHSDLVLLLCGVSRVDVAEWRRHALVERPPSLKDDEDHQKYLDSFWNLVSAMSPENIARLLHFTTGSTCLPPGGFDRLMPKFTIVLASSGLLPTAHTCFNSLTLPIYETQQELSRNLNVALEYGTGFGLR